MVEALEGMCAFWGALHRFYHKTDGCQSRRGYSSTFFCFRCQGCIMLLKRTCQQAKNSIHYEQKKCLLFDRMFVRRQQLIFIFQRSMARKQIRDQTSKVQIQRQGLAVLCHSWYLDRSHSFTVGVKTVKWKGVVNDDITPITQLLLQNLFPMLCYLWYHHWHLFFSGCNTVLPGLQSTRNTS